MNLKTVPATIALGSAGLALMTAGAWFTVAGPTLSSINEAGSAHSEAQDRTDNLNLQLAGLRRQAADLPQTEAIAKRLSKVWPATADQPAFFAQINDAALDAGIAPEDITQLSPSVPEIIVRKTEAAPAAVTAATSDAPAPAAPTDPADIPVTTRSVAVQDITVAVTGDYDELSQFMENLEGMPRGLLVRTLTVTTGAEQGAGDSTTQGAPVPVITLTVVGSTFVAPPLEQATAPSS